MIKPTSYQPWEEWVRKKIEFYITSGKWDNINLSSLRNWLGNFNSDGQKYALALLDHLIYYSDKDIKRLCYYALTSVIYKEQLLNFEKRKSFLVSDRILERELKSRIDNTWLVPLLIESNPSESGNTIAREYTTTGLIAEEKVVRPDQILSCIYKNPCERILFVDDILASGDQIKTWWTAPSIVLGVTGQKESLAKIAAQHKNISFEVATFVATYKGLQLIQANRLENLKIHYCEYLSEEYSIFNNDSIFFTSKEEKEHCRSYLKQLCESKDIPLLGHNNLDFAVVFYHGAPNCSLPIFYEEREGWANLFSRRM